MAKAKKLAPGWERLKRLGAGPSWAKHAPGWNCTWLDCAKPFRTAVYARKGSQGACAKCAPAAGVFATPKPAKAKNVPIAKAPLASRVAALEAQHKAAADVLQRQANDIKAIDAQVTAHEALLESSARETEDLRAQVAQLRGEVERMRELDRAVATLNQANERAVAVNKLTREKAADEKPPKPAVPFRSSKERPPRVGDVVRFMRWNNGSSVSEPDPSVVVTADGMDRFVDDKWVRGQWDILEEGPDPHAAIVSERERAAWNAALDAVLARFDASERARDGIKALRK